MAQVSVIIPVYNTEKYLPECLDSVLGQTFQDFEIICVDDGSTDDSLSVLNKCAEHDSRITVLTQKNLFAGAARNNGIEHANGKYLYFMDSDDFIKPDLLEKTVNKAESTNADIVVFGADDYNAVTGETLPHPTYIWYDLIKDFDVFNRDDIPETIFNFSNPAPWTKLYRKDFVEKNSLKFQGLPYSNDLLFTKLSFAVADRITCVNEPLLCYRIGMSENSQSRKFNDPYRYMESLGALKSELKKRGLYEKLEESFRQYVINCVYYEMKPYARRADRIEAYDRVLNDPMVSDALEVDAENCLEPAKLSYVKGLKGALLLDKDLHRGSWPEAEFVCESDNVIEDPEMSVVIPVYNNEKYIAQCLDSLTSQDYDKAEIIVVDDGSTDGTLDLLRKYASEHDNIRIFTEENSGPSTARNNGIQQAEGNILVMVDSDDLLADGALSLIAEKMNDNELLFYNVKPFMEDEHDEALKLSDKLEVFRKYYKRDGEYSENTVTGVKLFSKFIGNSDYLPSPVFQAVRRDFFIDNYLWFIDGILHEDHYYLFRAMLLADKVSVISSDLYLRRVRPESIMTGSIGWRNVYGYYLSYRKMSDFYYNGRNDHKWSLYHQDIYKALKSVLSATRRDYLEIKEDDKYFWHGLDDQEKDMFESLVLDYDMKDAALTKARTQRDSARKSLKKAKNKIKKLEAEEIKGLPRKVFSLFSR